MAGVELIVGTVLGSVPIILEAYDRSGRVFEVFAVFRQYPKEVRLLEAKLGAQRAIFRNDAINLLTAITQDRAKVEDVMNQTPSQAASLYLTLSPVYQHQLDALDESFNACLRTAEQINYTLQSLCSQFETFRNEVGNKRENMRTSDWLRHVKTRIQLGLNKPRIETAIEELRGFNKDFGLITAQIMKALQDILKNHKDEKYGTTIAKKSAKNLNTLQKYHRVRYAFNALYSTLQVRWVCSSHLYHSFDVRVLENGSGKGKDKPSLTQYVTCELAITPDGAPDAPDQSLRLEVEQACESDDEDASAQQAGNGNLNVQQLAAALETHAGKFKLVNQSKSTNKFRKPFQDPTNVQQQQSAPSVSEFAPRLPHLTQTLVDSDLSTELRSMTITASSRADLSLIDDLCKKSHKAMAACKDRFLLESWEGLSTQLFCFPDTSQPVVATSQSLSDIIQWISEEPVLRSLSRPLLVELAGNVAEGIMQFYSTPWLAPKGLGQNVRYLNFTESCINGVQLKGPYFMTRLKSAQTNGNTESAATEGLPMADKCDTVEANFKEARNQLLFNFGILLLEIGYGRPWHKLKQSIVKAPAVREDMSDYRAAEKLAQLLVNQMGLTYPKIIKKCLGCDFGLGETDLENEDLQRQFLEDVVLSLRQLKEHMREMNFAHLI